MSAVTTHAISSLTLPQQEEGKVTYKFLSFTSSAISSGDNWTLFTLPNRARVVDSFIKISGALGNSATLQLRQDTTALQDAATSAAVKRMNVFPPTASDGDDVINLLVGTGNVTSTSVTVDVMVAYVLT